MFKIEYPIIENKFPLYYFSLHHHESVCIIIIIIIRLGFSKIVTKAASGSRTWKIEKESN